MVRKFIFIILLILFVPVISSHQPRIIHESSLTNPVFIDNPEISKAYYGILNGSAHYYKIYSNQTFLFYVNILSPNVTDSRIDFSVDLIKDNQTIYTLNGNNWTLFYEEFGKDYYLMGPEYETNLSAGIYYLKVYNSDNFGRYSLAVGKTESFPPKEIINALYLSPTLKEKFFDKSPFSAFLNVFSLFFLLIIIVLVVAIYFLIKFLKKKFSKKRK